MARSFVLILVVFSVVYAVGAQTADVAADFERLHKAAVAKLDRVAHREVSITEDFKTKDGILEVKDVRTSLFLPPASRHITRSQTRPDGVYLSEDIFIRKLRYWRVGNGEWKKEIYPGDKFLIRGYGAEVKTTVDLKGEVDLDGNKAQLFVITRTSSYWKLPEIEHVWFGTTGLLLKSTKEGDLGQGTTYRKELTMYEYVKNFRIKAPVLKSTEYK